MVTFDCKIIFWDFDGVIKDSVKVKSVAFEQLFSTFGKKFAKKVRVHHEKNGGVSRFIKIPKYLKWTEKKVTKPLIDEYTNLFSLLTKKKVIDSDWVKGVLSYLESNYNNKYFFLVTATPQEEIDEIISSLKIKHFFQEIIGAPTSKSDAIARLLVEYSTHPEDAIMIGDSISDYEAAVCNRVPFVLRCTDLNKELQKTKCIKIDNFE